MQRLPEHKHRQFNEIESTFVLAYVLFDVLEAIVSSTEGRLFAWKNGPAPQALARFAVTLESVQELGSAIVAALAAAIPMLIAAAATVGVMWLRVRRAKLRSERHKLPPSSAPPPWSARVWESLPPSIRPRRYRPPPPPPPPAIRFEEDYEPPSVQPRPKPPAPDSE